MQNAKSSLGNADIVIPAIGDAFRKLSPRSMIRNPVMFVVEVLAALVTVLFIRDIFTGAPDLGFSVQVIIWLWSRCCSRTSPKPSLKGAARRRPPASKRRAARWSPNACRAKRLSPKEYDILRLLVLHAGKVLTHRFLMNDIWGAGGDVQYLRIYVRQLRAKIEPRPEQPDHIVTETGVGYRLQLR